MAFSDLKFLFTAIIFLAGITLGWLYLRKPPTAKNPKAMALIGDRPWRRVGGAICILLSVMFVLGVYVVDVPDHPRVYAAFWTVMLVLVMWLMVLAARDLLHTRKIVAHWHETRRNDLESLTAPDSIDREDSEP
ncbi:MAG: hypothetical protein JSU63_17435 [Phycisphaerales bacterium]|nr:MAG: hypothetical protein JSU63_17435 [Phycisphaerales bacterium]